MINLSNYGRELELLAYKSVNENRTALDDYDDLMAKKDNYYKNQYQQLVNQITKDVNAGNFGAQNTTISHDDGTPMVMVNYYITDGNPIRVDIVKSAMQARPSGDKKVQLAATGTSQPADSGSQPTSVPGNQDKPTQTPNPGYQWTKQTTSHSSQWVQSLINPDYEPKVVPGDAKPTQAPAAGYKWVQTVIGQGHNQANKPAWTEQLINQK